MLVLAKVDINDVILSQVEVKQSSFTHILEVTVNQFKEMHLHSFTYLWKNCIQHLFNYCHSYHHTLF